MDSVPIGSVIDGNRLYEYYRQEPRRSVLEGLVESWRNRRDISEFLGVLRNWSYGEITVALHLLKRHVSPELADVCGRELKAVA